jgi:uracil permease
MEDLTPKSLPRQVIVGVQFMFVAFGAMVLVPLLVGIDPAIAMFTAGLGTLLFHLITKGKVPVFIGSSFAFIAPIVKATEMFGYGGMLSGIIAVGVVYTIMSGLIKIWGLGFIDKLFPPIVVGPVIMVIGLSLATVGVNMAKTNWPIAIVALLTSVGVVIYTRGLIKLIPIFIGIIAGYLLSMFLGVIDYTPIHEADWFALPALSLPDWSWKAFLYMAPVAVAPMIEHIGDMYAIGGVTEKNYLKDPGLHRTLLGDGLATAMAGFMGSVPNTTYSEVTGAINLTKVTQPRILRITAIAAIVFSVIGKVSATLKTIPEAVLGGIMMLLFGLIASVGIKTVVDSRIDFHDIRNQVIASIILTVGIGGAIISIGDFSLGGIGLASVVGVILNLILPKTKGYK